MLYIVAILIALSAFGTWKVQEWRHDSQEKQRVEAQREKERNDRRTVDVAATGHEKDKVQIRTVTKTIFKEVDRVVKEPFYAGADAVACLDADGLRIAAEAAAGRSAAASEPARAVPAAGPAHWWQPRRSAPVDR